MGESEGLKGVGEGGRKENKGVRLEKARPRGPHLLWKVRGPVEGLEPGE